MSGPVSALASVAGGRRGRADLIVGFRLARAGGRSGVTRLLLTGLGVGLCLFVLLAVTAAGPAVTARGDRQFAGDDLGGGASFQAHSAALRVGDMTVTEMAVVRLRPDAPAPPGIPEFPAVGQTYVSPALATAMRGPDAARFHLWVPGTVVGLIAEQALPGPRDLTFYLGVAATDDRETDSATTWMADHQELDVRAVTVLTTGGTILIVVLLLFVSLVGRLGAAARDRRLTAISLLGVGSRRLRRISAVEPLLAAAAGLVLGWSAFLAARQFAPTFSIGGHGFHPADIWPGAPVAAAVTVAVLLTTVLPALSGSRRRRIEPLGGARRTASRPATTWRVIFVLLALASAGIDLIPGNRIGAPVFGQNYLTVLAILMLCSVPVALPWTLDRLTRRWSAGGPASRIAIGRIRADPTTAARSVAGVALCLAGGIAVAALLGYAQMFTYGPATATPPARSASTSMQAVEVAELPFIRSDLSSVGGVSQLRVVIPLWISTGDSPDPLTVADCASVRLLTDVGECRDGQAFTFRDQPTPWIAGTPATVSSPTMSFAWTVPTGLTPVRARHQGSAGGGALEQNSGLLLTPAAFRRTLPSMAAGPQPVLIEADITPQAVPQARDALAPFGWRAGAAFAGRSSATTGQSLDNLVVPALIAGSALTLLVCALGQIVVTVEMLVERRRSLALATATGVPRSVLIRAALIAALLPITVGVALAAGFGSLLAFSIMRMSGLPGLAVNVPAAAMMSVAAVTLVLLVSSATVPLLRRMTGGSAGLRTE